MQMGAGFVGVGILALALAGPVGAETTLKEKVESRLTKSGLAARSSIEVQTEPGDAVVLSGMVTSLADAQRAEREAGKVAKSVENRLRIAVPARKDAEIEKDIRKAILGYVHYSVFDSVGIAVQDGNVVMEGSVYQGYRKTDLEDRVAAVPGVRTLTSNVAVQHASAFDDRLRLVLLRRIYGVDNVLTYTGPNPPVRIVVDRGRVTLTGYVNSRVDQVKIGMLARETFALGVDNQIKLDSEMNKEPVKPARALEI